MSNFPLFKHLMLGDRYAQHAGAIFSEDAAKTYRFALWRSWDNHKPACNFILLNPSTADGVSDDPTIARLKVRAKQAGFGGIVVTNVFAWRSTSPDDLVKAARSGRDVVGADNDVILAKWAKHSEAVIIGWGKHAERAAPGRSAVVLGILKSLQVKVFAVAWNDDGSPRHPLYVPYA